MVRFDGDWVIYDVRSGFYTFAGIDDGTDVICSVSKQIVDGMAGMSAPRQSALQLFSRHEEAIFDLAADEYLRIGGPARRFVVASWPTSPRAASLGR